MDRARTTLDFVQYEVVGALFAIFLGMGPAYALHEAANTNLPDRPSTSVAAEESCRCDVVGALSPEARSGLRPSPLGRRVFTKILDGSSCGGFGGGTCFATDNSVCYLEITCNDNGCIMDCR